MWWAGSSLPLALGSTSCPSSPAFFLPLWVFVNVPGVAASLVMCQSPTRVMATAPVWQGTWAWSSASRSPGHDMGAKAPRKNSLGQNNSLKHSAKVWSSSACVRTRVGPLQILRATPPPESVPRICFFISSPHRDPPTTPAARFFR